MELLFYILAEIIDFISFLSGNYPTIQVHASSVQHLDLEPGKLIGPTVVS